MIHRGVKYSRESPQMFLGGANHSTETLNCSLDHQNIPHWLSNILGVRVVAQRQVHHTSMNHLMGIVVTRHGILGGGVVYGALDLFHDTLNCSTDANIAQRPQVVH